MSLLISKADSSTKIGRIKTYQAAPLIGNAHTERRPGAQCHMTDENVQFVGNIQ